MLVDLAAALVPLLVGAIWYNPYLAGRFLAVPGAAPPPPMPAWRTALIFLVTYIGSYFIATALGGVVIHQWGFHGMLANHGDELKDSTSQLYGIYHGLLDKYGSEFRTFKHGAFHGYQLGLKLVFPIILIIGLFEQKKAAWIIVHAVYWTICLALMGGIVCAYMPIP
jgi:hypothetical protein